MSQTQQAQHTPDQWTTNGRYIYAADRKAIADCSHMDRGHCDLGDEASQLIAASIVADHNAAAKLAEGTRERDGLEQKYYEAGSRCQILEKERDRAIRQRDEYHAFVKAYLANASDDYLAEKASALISNCKTDG